MASFHGFPMSLEITELSFLSNLVLAQTGTRLSTDFGSSIETRLRPLAVDFGFPNVTNLIQSLYQPHSRSIDQAVADALLINETSFFREAKQFRSISQHLIPALLDKPKSQEPIRIWSAACSSGQEAYSLAMDVKEHQPQLGPTDFQILASDISQRMVDRARQGEFTNLEVERGLPATKRARYFDRMGSSWRATNDLKNLIHFRQVNLAAEFPYIGRFDIILIRNVLIYFDLKTKTEVLRRVSEVLNPGGCLFIGSAETLIGTDLPLRRDKIDGTVCYRRHA
jgi:chemotaxis protein methyltransferase CheR